MTEKADALQKLRETFPANQISKLPRETKAQREERQADRTKAINCQECGGWHHKNAIHLDYVGHAALTDRLLDTDPEWSWEPLAYHADGLPAFDGNPGLWIKLTVCGVTRLGYGAADGKTGGDAVKEIIGDALRNAAMRFGAALDLWHKGTLHDEDETRREKVPGITKIKERLSTLMRDGNAATSRADLQALIDQHRTDLETIKNANHEWWTGDGEDFEGFSKWITRRRSELPPSMETEQGPFQPQTLTYQLLISTLNECTSTQDLQSWLNKNGQIVENDLDENERASFEAIYDQKAEALKLLDTTTVGG